MCLFSFQERKTTYMYRHVPHNPKSGRELKFGGLVVCLYNRQIKIYQNFAILHRIAKFNKSSNVKFAMAILTQTNRQIYFLLMSLV